MGGKRGGATLPVTRVSVPSRALPADEELKRVERLLAQPNIEGRLVDRGGFSSSQCLLIREGHAHGFIAAVTSAFKHHYPLSLRPQHIWLIILQAVAVHVNNNAKELREKWLKGDSDTGKKITLEVVCDDFEQNDNANNDWGEVVHQFSAQIEEHTRNETIDAILPAFSDSDLAETVAMKITVMDICQNYFDYCCTTSCGFPSITLEGTETDWKKLRLHAEELVSNYCTAEFAEFWLPSLLPLLDKFHQQYVAATSKSTLGFSGVDSVFWNSMCKLGGTKGSGSRTWFNGWFNILFPVLQGFRNSYCVPYSTKLGYVKEGLTWNKRYGHGFLENMPDGVVGPDCEHFPNGLANAPVIWNYYGRNTSLRFYAGFVGAKQDPETLVISPQVGWFVCKNDIKNSSHSSLSALQDIIRGRCTK